MKIKTEDIKKIVEEVVKNALSEQEEGEATKTTADPKIKDADKAKMKLDAQNALIALLQFIDTPAEIEEFVRSIIVRLDPRKVTDQELFV